MRRPSDVRRKAHLVVQRFVIVDVTMTRATHPLIVPGRRSHHFGLPWYAHEPAASLAMPEGLSGELLAWRINVVKRWLYGEDLLLPTTVIGS